MIATWHLDSSTNGAASGASEPLYVITLCASTSPVALAHPRDPQLKRYTFFVTRQREEGRDRFRLHMGYFATLGQAEALLTAVRGVYPAAWAGSAPSGGAPRRMRKPALMSPVPSFPSTASTREVPKTLSEMSNVHAVLAKLHDDPAQGKADEVLPVSVPTLAPLAPRARTGLTAAQTLQMLENRLKKSAAQEKAPVVVALPLGDASADASAATVTPQDSPPPADINAAPPEASCFAVQLLFSTEPVNIASQPHLAIFDAYTLYSVEGAQEGQRGHVLRLGFFKDEHAATQVAHYVRSDYAGVAVVTVADAERDNATGIDRNTTIEIAAPPAPFQFQHTGFEGLELLKDDQPSPIKLDLDDSSATATEDVGIASTGRRAALRQADQKAQIVPGAAVPLDETFEILGADTLTLDDSREIINESALYRPSAKKPEGRFARLFSRLSGH